MFEDIEKKILTKKPDILDDIQAEMKDTLPYIYRALHPPIDAMAVETRLQLQESAANLQAIAGRNPEFVLKQRALFQEMLDKFTSISNRIDQVLTKPNTQKKAPKAHKTQKTKKTKH